MHTNTTENTNGINIKAVSGYFTDVAKRLKVDPAYVRNIAHDRVLVAKMHRPATVLLIIKALKRMELVADEVENALNDISQMRTDEIAKTENALKLIKSIDYDNLK